jgi:cellulose synthase/poly-beta-1,6-N-acetylglucosamine synthase-like glycosyltransferase
MTAKIIFYISATLLFYTYLVYPIMVMTIASFRKSIQKKAAITPSVSILMPVYNEEKVTGKKIESLLASNYPPELLEIIIGSDASTDHTDEIVRTYADKHAGIRFFRCDARQGKAAMLNILSSEAKGELLLITDANVIPGPDCIKLISEKFADEQTGLCDSLPVAPEKTGGGIAIQEKMYSSFEMRLKNAEGRAWGTMTGPYGGFYCVRKSLFPKIPENILVDDLYVGLSIINRGYKAVNENNAVVTEDIPADIKEQYRRRVRISTGSFQNLFYWGPFLKKPLSMASFCFFSHKVLRWFTPCFFIVLFMTSVILSGHSVLYFAFLILQVFFLLLPMLDILLLKAGITLRPLRFATQFLMMNAALAAGLTKAIRGVKEGIWEPTKRV